MYFTSEVYSSIIVAEIYLEKIDPLGFVLPCKHKNIPDFQYKYPNDHYISFNQRSMNRHLNHFRKLFILNSFATFVHYTD